MEENNLSKSTHRQLLNKVISKYTYTNVISIFFQRDDFKFCWYIYISIQPLYLKICLAITALSTMFLEEGKRTGSLISVPMMGSRNSSGASAYSNSSSACFTLRT